MNILLIGLRGSGKSTVGRALADLLRRPFVDLDQRVLATFCEPSVSAVWSAHGEAAWRDAEARLLGETLKRADQVVALGGGTPMIDAARHLIETEQRAGRASVVYLRCAADELTRRLTRAPVGGDRPSLTGDHPAREVGVVLEAREPTYRALADRELDVTSTTPQSAAEALRDLA